MMLQSYEKTRSKKLQGVTKTFRIVTGLAMLIIMRMGQGRNWPLWGCSRGWGAAAQRYTQRWGMVEKEKRSTLGDASFDGLLTESAIEMMRSTSDGNATDGKRDRNRSRWDTILRRARRWSRTSPACQRSVWARLLSCHTHTPARR